MLAVTSLALAATTADAQTGSFTFRISEKELKLEHPTDMMWDKQLMWDLGFQRMNDRNMPYIELVNAATSTAPITEFHMTIGDTRFNFTNDALGTYALLGSTTPGFPLTSSTIGGNELVVNIGDGGLLPGETVRFKIDLDVDVAQEGDLFTHPDFRTVLFDMNGINVYDNTQQISTADNARVWVTFDPASGPNFQSTPVPLQDALVFGAAANFFNDNMRQWGEPDPVRIFEVGGSGVIPEPSSALLFAGISCALGLVARRSSRRHLAGVCAVRRPAHDVSQAAAT
jgi:hypothetical protein